MISWLLLGLLTGIGTAGEAAALPVAGASAGTSAVVAGLVAAPSRTPAAALPKGLTHFVLGVLFAIASAPILLSYLLGRAGRENVWLSLLSLCLAVNTLVISGWPRLWTDHFGLLTRLETVSGHLAAACAIQFLWPFLHRPIGRLLRAYQWSHVALAAFAALWPSLTLVVATGQARFLWLLPLLLLAAVLTVQEARRGSSEARFLGFAGLVFVAAEVYELGYVWLSWPRLGMSLVPFGFAAVLVALWTGETIRVRRNHLDLEELRVSLEQRVAKRTRSHHLARLAADRATRARDEFVFTLSHEVRNPLYSILGLADWIMDRQPPPLERALVEMIRGSGRSLVTLLDSVLDVARLDEGRHRARSAPFDPRSTVEAVADMAAPMVWDRGLELKSGVDGEVPPLVVGDAERFSEVLYNLVSNAAKFTQQGEVDVRVTCRQLEGRTSELHCSVADTGPGIPAELMPSLFEPFWKEGGKARGSGLGLAISRRLVELMRGRIWAEPRQQGTGTVFHFTARVTVPGQEMQALLARLGEICDLHALLVDPDAGFRAAMIERLVAFGLHPKAVSDVEQAVGWLRAGRRTDMVLASPRLTGEERQVLGAEAAALGGTVPVIEAPAELPVCGSQEAAAFLREILDRMARRPATVETSPQAPLRILVVEDDEINLKITLHLLQRLGQSPDSATNGEDAMLALGLHRYDLVFLDLGLTETSGLDVARRIRAELPPDRQPFIAALTGRADAPTRELCLQAGMDEFLTKPVEPRDLEALIQAGRPRQAQGDEVRAFIAGETPDQAVLDRERIAVLAELGAESQDDVLAQLIDSYLDGSNLDLATMLRAANDDRRQLSMVAHRLAGRSANLGLSRVAAVCRQLELVAGSAKPPHLRRMLQGLGEELDEAAKALLQQRSEADLSSGSHP